MLIVGLVLAAAAAAFHVFIFALESLKWTEPETRKIFGVASEADAVTMKALAFNQGFYNLFLAIAAVLGIVLFWVGEPGTAADVAGRTLVLFSLGSMVAAAMVLLTTGRRYLGAALIQGTLPLIGFVLFLFA